MMRSRTNRAYEPKTPVADTVKLRLLSELNNVPDLMHTHVETIDVLEQNPGSIVLIDNKPVFDPYGEKKGEFLLGNIGIYKGIEGFIFVSQDTHHLGIEIALQYETKAELIHNNDKRTTRFKFISDEDAANAKVWRGGFPYTEPYYPPRRKPPTIYGKSEVFIAEKEGDKYQLNDLNLGLRPYQLSAAEFLEQLAKHPR